MTTPSGIIVEHAYRPLEVCDKAGRNLKVRRINALDRLRLLKVAGPELSQNDAWLNMAALAFSVMEINGTPRVSPSSERQIEALVSELGDIGLDAITDVLTENDNTMQLFDGPPVGNAEGTPS